MLKDMCRINVSVARNNLDVLQRRETTVMNTQHGCRPPCCLVFAEALNCERINRKALGLIQPPPDNWGIDKLRVSGNIDKCGTEGLVPDGEDGCQRENRSTSTRSSTPHLPRVFSILGFSIFSPLFTFFHTHLSSPLFLLSRPARAPHINRLWLIRCKCEMHKKKRALAKIRSLVCKQLSTTVQGRTGRTGRSRWCNMRLHKSPGDPRQIQRNEHKPRAALHTVTQDKLR